MTSSLPAATRPAFRRTVTHVAAYPDGGFGVSLTARGFVGFHTHRILVCVTDLKSVRWSFESRSDGTCTLQRMGSTRIARERRNPPLASLPDDILHEMADALTLAWAAVGERWTP